MAALAAAEAAPPLHNHHLPLGKRCAAQAHTAAIDNHHPRRGERHATRERAASLEHRLRSHGQPTKHVDHARRKEAATGRPRCR